MIVRGIQTRVFREKEALLPFIFTHIKRLPEGAIVVVTSKIVSLSEGRTAEKKGEKAKVRLIKEESQWDMKTKYVWLTIKDNLVMANAGIDESNGRGKLILLPRDCYRTAADLRRALRKHYRVKNFGVVITDSRLMPLRSGTVGVALGYAGFRGIKQYVGSRDIFGKVFEYQRSDIADSLATAAVLTMGEGAERRPLAIIEGAPVEFTERTNRRELQIDIKEDVYQPLFAQIKRIKLRKKRRS